MASNLHLKTDIFLYSESQLQSLRDVGTLTLGLCHPAILPATNTRASRASPSPLASASHPLMATSLSLTREACSPAPTATSINLIG
jgi:hypothetical protein